MLSNGRTSAAASRGYTMIEVLITMVVLAVGILGLAGLMVKMNQAEAESYQRSQAQVLLQEMSSRIAVAALGAGCASGINASSSATCVPSTATLDPYVTTTPLGTGDTQPALPCTGLTGAALDQCNWSNHLKGAAEVLGGNKVGAMIGARGCVEVLQTLDATPGVCQPGIYRVSVVWQGLAPTVQSSLTCGQNLYGANDALRRGISTTVTVGLPSCM